jgi:hypothetical protein
MRDAKAPDRFFRKTKEGSDQTPLMLAAERDHGDMWISPIIPEYWEQSD